MYIDIYLVTVFHSFIYLLKYMCVCMYIDMLKNV